MIKEVITKEKFEKFVELSDKELKNKLKENHLIKTTTNLHYACQVLNRSEDNKIIYYLPDHNDVTITKNKNLGKRFTYNDFQILRQRFAKDRLSISLKKKLENLLKFMLKTWFSEDRFWIFSDTDENYINVLVFYPEILIQNSLDEKHLMKEIYVMYKIDRYNLSVPSIKMTRTQYSFEELLVNYTFSHFNGSIFDSNMSSAFMSSAFCFGSTNLRKLTENLEKVNHSLVGFLKNFEQIVCSFESYLSWESVEGVPYYYIKNISLSKFISSYSDYQSYGVYTNLLKNSSFKDISSFTDLCLKNIIDFYYDLDTNSINITAVITKENIMYEIKDYISLCLSTVLPKNLLLFQGNRTVDLDILIEIIEDKIANLRDCVIGLNSGNIILRKEVSSIPNDIEQQLIEVINKELKPHVEFVDKIKGNIEKEILKKIITKYNKTYVLAE